ncbi:hypothetical protein [Amycolatopsis sp. Hca4]|uniref:hypothetical protein n=1 Tax=Amycolatopsis sp. Hca4 TaxID=2742131 RepID=UPI00159063B2|nr:hypothetical protein [Amycolatopsis sp. Hca4]QKV80327.1 hypothetical protein HUT10_45970 [Amycolatopsis sp. Hca4]
MGRTIRRAGVAAVLLPLVAAGLAVNSATPASAAPTACTNSAANIDYVLRSSWTRCWGGTGHFKVLIGCKSSPGSPWTALVQGPVWVSVQEGAAGVISAAVCPPAQPLIVEATTLT